MSHLRSWIAALSVAKLRQIAIAPPLAIGIAAAIALASTAPVHAQFASFGRSSVRATPYFGQSRSRIYPRGRTVIIQRPAHRYLSFPGQSGFSSHRRSIRQPFYHRSPTVIVTPGGKTRRVIVNPNRIYNKIYDGRSTCGTAIYGSPIPSPILVNPRTGLACR
ncbi:hypothetical protein [Myxacorys almedinensis]|uniref:Uncharacterized protein n=1 Tax=Myxacorys almedinensis A TaxID=2690445 RepID=A0A8J7Z0U1_9CYAN|nr:hypothetical protein [Myxacorys almedinensis]NDJ18029.1 hypothetical protein [Myxacorys almedinensis A]